MPGLLIAPKAPAASGAGTASGAALTENDGADASKDSGGGTFGSILAGQIKSNSPGAKNGAEAKAVKPQEKSAAGKADVDSLATDGTTTANAVNDFLALVNAGVAAIQITPTPLAPAAAAHGGDQLALAGAGAARQASDAAATQLAGLVGKDFAAGGKILPKDGPADLKDAEAATGEDKGRFAVDGLPAGGKILQATEPLTVKPLLEEFKPDKPIPRAAEASRDDMLASSLAPQAAAMPVNRTPAGQTPPMEIAQPVGSPGWGGALADKVTWMSSQGNHVAELHLNPPNLGPLEVQLTVVNDQASAVFVSPHATVRDAIEAAMPKLRDMLADSGIMLGNTMVGAESFQQQQQQQQAFAKQTGGGGGARGEITELGSVGSAGGGKVMSAGNGMVDTFV